MKNTLFSHLRVVAKVMTLSLAAAGCSAAPVDEVDSLGQDDAPLLRKTAQTSRWLYQGPLPELDAPEVTVSLAGHTVHVTGLVPLSFRGELPYYVVTEPAGEEPAVTDDKPEEPQTPVEVLYDINKAPEAVRRMRQLIVEAAASGDIERLRPLLGKGVTETQVSIVESDEGPVETLKGQSGDSDGVEVLAILLDVLATGFVHVGQGTPDEMYVWPYFAEMPLAGLTPPEKVELLRIVTAGDFSDMQEFGSYNFYRVGITPDGQWKFFVTGD